MTLKVEGVSKAYGQIQAVAAVSLEVTGEGTLALLGPSGCGKSTLLRLIAGLELPDAGGVLLDGRDITALPPQRRPIGMVFQDYALFPHLDVGANVGFALREKRVPGAQTQRRVEELLELVGLGGTERRRVFELSGGQQQRVALARALAAEPSLLLLDEPLSSLDPGLRQSLLVELRELLSRLEVRAVYVTHDQSEALTVAPRLALMKEGRIVQEGPGERMLERPRDSWVAAFLGYRNIYPAGLIPGAPSSGGPLLVRDELLRPGGSLPARVVHVERRGQRLRLHLELPSWGVELSWEGYPRELPASLAAGDELGFEVPEGALVPLEADA